MDHRWVPICIWGHILPWHRAEYKSCDRGIESCCFMTKAASPHVILVPVVCLCLSVYFFKMLIIFGGQYLYLFCYFFVGGIQVNDPFQVIGLYNIYPVGCHSQFCIKQGKWNKKESGLHPEHPIPFTQPTCLHPATGGGCFLFLTSQPQRTISLYHPFPMGVKVKKVKMI